MTITPEELRARTKRHQEMLVVATLVVALSFLLQVLPNGRVGFRGFQNYPLPHTCMSYAWFGVQCPGCGLTRSFIHLARGDWEASCKTHRIGWVLAAVILIQFPYRLAALRWPHRFFPWIALANLFGCFLIALLLANWLVDLMELTRPG